MNDLVFDLIKEEEKRQEESLMLIPSENYASKKVRDALASVFTNKYAEGYSGRRYYQGNEVVDKLEDYACELGKKIFGFEHINVQPYSGSPANTAVLFALVDPGDVICGMQLSAGGHLTHGHPKITFSGKYFRSVQYGVDESGRIDYDALSELVKTEKPKLIFAGTTAYPYKLDWERFASFAQSVGAWLVADISHISGLVAAGIHESPTDYAHIVTSTTHKTLRGPKGAFIGVTNNGLEKDDNLIRKIDRAVFPGLQGGPHMNAIAAMAVAFEEALTNEFADYAKKVVANALSLAEGLKEAGLKVYGTENHLILVEVGKEKGKGVAVKLEEAGLVVNANTVPFDEGSPMSPSGIRIGTPAVTTRGMGREDMKKIAGWINAVIGDADTAEIRKEVISLCQKYPCPK